MALMYDMNTVNAAMMKAVEASRENLPEGEKLKKVLNCFAGMKPVEAEPVVHAMWERSRGNSLFRCTNCKHIVRLMGFAVASVDATLPELRREDGCAGGTEIMAEEKLVRVDDVVRFLKEMSASVQDKVGDMLFAPQMEALIVSAFALNQTANAVLVLPTVDAVPAVRCKDCRRRGKRGECPLVHLVIAPDGLKDIRDYSDDNGFCYYGDKKVEE